MVTVDLPSDDETAGWWEYADAVVQAIGDRRDVVVVGHSLGGFTAPLVCTRTPVDLLVLVATMIPWPGELFSDWWKNTGYEASGYNDVFYHDVPPELAAETKRRERDETARALQEPWPLEAWAGHADQVPAVPRRPDVPSGVGATTRPRAPRHRRGRD